MIDKIAQKINDAGGSCYFVGGYVRDTILGIPNKDIDCEVFGLSSEKLFDVLSEFGDVKVVGESFGIFKLDDFDFAIPRKETAIGSERGHKNFDIQLDPNLTIVQAAQRRDFTINAIYKDVITGDVFDPCDGVFDLKNKILAHVSDKFVEDPLRVLRAMQFCGRFDLEPSEELIVLCRSMINDFQYLSKERVWDEWVKFLTKSKNVHKGLNFLRDCGWLTHFPELVALCGCGQNPEWHPEGDVWNHTAHVLQAANTDPLLYGQDKLTIMLAALCHDLGKPATTTVSNKGKIIAPKHAALGVNPTKSLLEKMGLSVGSTNLINKVCGLVREHMVHCSVKEEPSRKMLLKLRRRLQDDGLTIHDLASVCYADTSGRPPKARAMPLGFQMIIEGMEDIPKIIEPIVLGRHLIEKGWKPGIKMGVKIHELFEAQLNGEFSTLEEGLKLV